MKVLLIGCGKMGGAMLRQWAKEDGCDFTVADPAPGPLPDGVRHVTGADQLSPAEFDIAIIAVKPQMIGSLLPDYAPAVREGGCFVSIAAGCSIASLEKVVGERAIVRVMPNLAAMVGMGVSGLYANARCSETQVAAVACLVEMTGRCVKLTSEEEIDRLTAVSGSGPGYLFEFMRSYVEAAERLGFDAQTARALVFDTISGTVETARRENQSLEELRNSVTSKNGTTQAGLDQLRRDGLLQSLMNATVDAAYMRAAELR